MAAEPPRRELAASARALAGVAWRSARLPLAGFPLVMAAEALAPVAVAWLTKLVLDGLTGNPAPGLGGLAVGLAAAGLAAAALPHGSSYLTAEIGRRVEVDATDRLFAATVRQPGLRRFEDPRFLDRLRLAQEGAGMGGNTVIAAFGLGRGALTLVGFVGSLLVISPVMTAVVLASAAPALAAQLRLSRQRADMAVEIGPVERRQIFYSRLLSSVDAATEIRLFGSGGFLRGRLLALLRTATAARRRMDQRELGVEGALAALGAAVAGGGLIWAIGAARAGSLTVGDVSLFAAAVASVQGALAALVAAIATGHHGLLLFGHHVAVTRAAPDLPIPARPKPLGTLRVGIELRDVWFRYSDDLPWVLRGVDLVIPAGAAVGLVGLNGAGKSTLVKLMCRFYDPTRGQILWDGTDLRDVRPEDLRQRVSAVFQDHMDYDLSARENVAIGDLTSLDDLARVRAAARRAGVDDVLQGLPRGYETLLTRMFFSEADREDPTTGVVLSGGQWQRVAVARALVREARDLMILDEPSAGLDPEAEASVHTRMRAHRAGRTSLLISHRLNTVRDADVLVVLEGGQVSEQGTHAELLAAGGAYARLFHLQATGYQLQPQEALG